MHVFGPFEKLTLLSLRHTKCFLILFIAGSNAIPLNDSLHISYTSNAVGVAVKLQKYLRGIKTIY